MLLTLKKSQTNSIDRNSESTKDQRVAYAQWFLTNLNSFDVTIFVDECGYKLWTRRSNGHSLKGLPAKFCSCHFTPTWLPQQKIY